MKKYVVVLAMLICVQNFACSPKSAHMDHTDFFLTPPKAERATLSGNAICIETEPLSFADAELDRELEPEILLEGLSFSSIDPAKLENTRYRPSSNYEGSFYFLAEHNWVDLKEIRFLDATSDSVLAEYDLIIHLPTFQPNEYPITIRVQTQIDNGEPNLEQPRSFDGLGTFVQDEEDLWKGDATYDGYDVEIELSASAATFDEIASFARSVLSENALPRSKMNNEISDELKYLVDRFKRLNVTTEIAPSDFIARRFYFYKRRHHEHPEMIIGLDHPEIDGHWSLTFNNLESGNLIFQPRSENK